MAALELAAAGVLLVPGVGVLVVVARHGEAGEGQKEEPDRNDRDPNWGRIYILYYI